MDQQIDRSVNHHLRYTGCIAINASMKSLEFAFRSAVAKECITRVCEAAFMIQQKKRKVDKQIRNCLPGAPNTDHSGEDIYLTVSTRHIVITRSTPPGILFDHELKDISFASAGDQETADFVAYVAKDETNGRQCYVFECILGRAQEVISSIGQAFTVRFEQMTSMPVRTISAAGVHHSPNTSASNVQAPEPPPRVSLASPRSPALIDFEISPTRLTHNSYVNTPDNFFAAGDQVVPSLPCLKNLAEEMWFHGRMSREESETLLQRDGEFIVRVSAKDPNQVVLTGMQNGVHKHLMLIDDEGKVRTKDREFESVSHLIEHHRNSQLPITSAESALLLRIPVNRRA